MTGAELQFREFFAAEYGRLRGLGYLLTSDWAEAEELAQDALVRTYRAWSRVRRHDRPGAYARKALVNRHRSLLRRARVEARNLAGRRGEEAVQPDLGLEGLVLWAAVRRLPARQRAARSRPAPTTGSCAGRRAGPEGRPGRPGSSWWCCSGWPWPCPTGAGPPGHRWPEPPAAPS